ncbi:MAG: hydrogenase maturation protease, partial [Candidatus Acidiferrales bacterium]
MNEWEWRLLEDKAPLDSLEIGGMEVRPGDYVRLRPREGHDVLDIALNGRIATVEAIEQDYEGKFHLAVIINDDPGRDLGTERQPGHRFFFAPGEVEPVDSDGERAVNSVRAPRILVAGIGNIFLGDDAFGVEVAGALAHRKLPASVRVTDFGIRGFDLAYALLDGYDVTILVDACPRGDAPGTLYVVEPDLDALDSPDAAAPIETHAM